MNYNNDGTVTFTTTIHILDTFVLSLTYIVEYSTVEVSINIGLVIFLKGSIILYIHIFTKERKRTDRQMI